MIIWTRALIIHSDGIYMAKVERKNLILRCSIIHKLVLRLSSAIFFKNAVEFFIFGFLVHEIEPFKQKISKMLIFAQILWNGNFCSWKKVTKNALFLCRKTTSRLIFLEENYMFAWYLFRSLDLMWTEEMRQYIIFLYYRGIFYLNCRAVKNNFWPSFYSNRCTTKLYDSQSFVTGT